MRAVTISCTSKLYVLIEIISENQCAGAWGLAWSCFFKSSAFQSAFTLDGGKKLQRSERYLGHIVPLLCLDLARTIGFESLVKTSGSRIGCRASPAPSGDLLTDAWLKLDCKPSHHGTVTVVVLDGEL